MAAKAKAETRSRNAESVVIMERAGCTSDSIVPPAKPLLVSSPPNQMFKPRTVPRSAGNTGLENNVRANSPIRASPPRNKALTQEVLGHRDSADNVREVMSHSGDALKEQTTPGTRSDANSTTSSLSLDARGFVEARARSARAGQSMKKVEADVTKWKEDVELERRRRANWEVTERRKEAAMAARGWIKIKTTGNGW